MEESNGLFCRPVDLSDGDIYEAMREIPGYLDITPGDFKEIYRIAFRRALERLQQPVPVVDIMSREVLKVKTDTSIIEVARLMAERGVSGAPVVDEEERVAGVISEKDFLALMGAGEHLNFMEVVARCLSSKGCVAAPMKKQSAGDIMSAPAVTVGPEATSADVLSIIEKRRINRVPVVDRTGGIIGIVTRADLLRFSGGKEKA
ncbi:MAG: CBS domain-containing protein [Desulforhabdus sp.]|jgi:CBS-domain-containing membrane protein|nr:CBS domain-containing protein [Desulforhabdus sp.]